MPSAGGAMRVSPTIRGGDFWGRWRRKKRYQETVGGAV
jgi:hypothetical protein